jgi:SAM-dependent methyltransferase
MAPETITRILELGCAAGRMLRFCPRTSADAELWGVDIKAAQIAWCQEHFPPPFRFATTTTLPHLPFEDRYFDFVFCGSVFTHIGDLADAWLLELRRILRPGGMAFITIHDEHSVDLLLHRERDRADVRFLVEMLERLEADTGALSRDYAYFAIGNEPWTQVFYNTKHVLRKWGSFMTVVSATPEAYGYQTALLLKK